MNRWAQAIAILGLLGVTPACNVGITGSGVSKTEVRELGEFRAVRNATVGNVIVAIGDSQSVEVTVDDNVLPIIVTEVIDGELVIKSSQSFSTSIGLKVSVTTPRLYSLSSSGVGSTRLTGMDGDELTIKLSGVGSVQADGRVESLNVSVSGVGNADLDNLLAENVSVKFSGVGSAYVHATKSVDASTSGVGSIKVSGNPGEKAVKQSGIGSVSFRD